MSREEAKIRTVGLSNFSAERIHEVFEVAEQLGLTTPVALQPKYNLVEREFEGDERAAAERHGLGVIPYYGLASGFLTGKYRSKEDLGKSARGGGVGNYLNDRGLRVLDVLDEIARDTGAAPLS